MQTLESQNILSIWILLCERYCI